MQVEKQHLIFASQFCEQNYFSLPFLKYNLLIFVLSCNMPFVLFTAASILSSHCTVINNVFKELA